MSEYEIDFVELTPEQVADAQTFSRRLHEIADGTKLSDRMLLAIIGGEMGLMAAVHAKNGCCSPEELLNIFVLNFKHGFIALMSDNTVEKKAMH